MDTEIDQVKYYTDSKVVLGYICNSVRRFYVYVANRVERIRRISRPKQWNYVPTGLNPADIATRSVPAVVLTQTIWFAGPKFLTDQSSIDSEEDIDFHLVDPDTDPEIQPEVEPLSSNICSRRNLEISIDDDPLTFLVLFEQLTDWLWVLEKIKFPREINPLVIGRERKVQFGFLLLISVMAAADLRDELSCSICTSIYTDPVSLPCGHNFCQGCVGKTWDWQEGIEEDPSCPECRQRFKRRPKLTTDWKLRGMVERFCPTETEPGETGIPCSYCLLSPVPAAKSCLLCEASLCDTHLRGHCQSAEHVLTKPTDSIMGRKCSVHHKVLEYHCCEDSACICVSCCLAGEHRGHRVELLSEASEKKKEKLRKVLEKLSPEREETERGAQRLQERRREVAEVAAGETERVTALFRGIREELEALEKRLLSDISRQKEKLCLQLTELIQQLEIKKDELSREIRHIEELCNMADPLTVLREQWESHGAAFCGAEGA
ncbi:probable E3 ubiquitin-protein ligase TRIM8, partial [Xenopus tropicalis]|uniref:Probable E3 ubiquitin-protein ligase TRIM8 n=1 Tax=Xenopus tropicalis TaxID=8364 RepID=A0A8J1JXP2_XENTR